MVIKNKRIIEATEIELFKYYLKRELDDIYSFPDYLEKIKNMGVKIIHG